MEALYYVDALYHGNGKIVFEWSPLGKFIASTGISRVIQIFSQNRDQMVDQIVPKFPAECVVLKWNRDGTKLCVLLKNASSLLIWNSNHKSVFELERNDKLCHMAWIDPHIVVATGKDMINMVSMENEVLWSLKVNRVLELSDMDNGFAMSSEDCFLKLFDANGKPWKSIQLKGSGGRLKFYSDKLAIVVNDDSIAVYDNYFAIGKLASSVVEITFKKTHGRLVNYFWMDSDTLIAGFYNGFLVMIDLSEQQNDEQYCQKLHGKDVMTGMAYQNGMVASIGDTNLIRIFNVSRKTLLLNLSMEEMHAWNSESKLVDVAWSKDGKILSVSNQQGCLYHFYTLPSLHEKPMSMKLKQGQAEISMFSFLTSLILLLGILLCYSSFHFNTSCMNVLKSLFLNNISL